jgi:type IV secretory pathway TraG/TraD family ATPase VirD4
VAIEAKLDDIYSHDADTVLTNHRTKLIFPSGLSDTSTANYITHLFGDEHVRDEIEERSLTGSASRRPDDRIPASNTPFLPAHVLRRAQPGDALLIHGKTPPAWLPARPQ